ncbi:MAG: TetR/AcrR family transcriptional regulator [Gammaproteobacteria bacterium]
MEKSSRKKELEAADTTPWQGRRAARAGSEARRRAILEAALRIIVRDGIRAVRHRAVAKEAGVPLSATTYYFKDIHDLIADAFTLFVENAMGKVIDPVWVEIYRFAGEYPPEKLRDPGTRIAFIAGLSALAADFVEREVTQHREHLLAEQAFLQAAILEPRLREQAAGFRRKVQEGLVMFCTMLGTIDPPMDAELIYEAFMQLEYENLMAGEGVFDRQRAERVLAHRFRLVAPG